jgi:outer membrane protein assembly factor BamE (lipoprotein component of BamABCDE complex)
MRTSNMNMNRSILILLTAATLLPLSGCLVSGSSRQTRSGNYVSDETFSQIKPGKTSAGWVMATLGEPSSKSRLDDGSEVWKWSYTEVKSSRGQVFLLFANRNHKETTGAAFVELKNGVVVNKWRS